MSKLLYSQEAIRERVASVARRISTDYAGRELDIVCLLNGASVFAADLMRHLEVPARLHQLGFTSYPELPKSGEVRITLDVAEPLQDRHVLVVEGIVVSGRTPRYLMDLLRLRRPASLEMCAVGTKPRLLAVELAVKYSLFEFGDEMAAGYGIGKGAERAQPHLVDMR